jgi:hypothetical protein
LEEGNDIIKDRNVKGGLASPNIMGGYGRDDFYSYYRKNGGTLNRDPFARILRECNKALMEELMVGAEDYTLPCGLGRISFRKRKNKAYVSNGGIKSTALIDWKKTMELWQSDPQAKRNKVLLRYTNMNTARYSFRIAMFNRLFKNKEYFAFRFKRGFKRKFSERINTYNLPKIEVEITKTI